MSNLKRKALFRRAIEDLGHEISFMENQKITIKQFSTEYSVPMELILKSIEEKKLQAHYDYKKEVVWLDLLDACYFSYCLGSQEESAN